MNLVVVGDSLLDVDVFGAVSRVCPDAPAPVLDEHGRRVRAGGAGLAACLAAGGGVPVTLVTGLGDDDEAALLREQLSCVRVVAGPAGGPTAVKTRLRASGVTLARMDRCRPARPAVTDGMLAAVEAADAVLVSDYGRGLTRDRRLRGVLERLAGLVPVVWDPHPRGTAPVPGVAVATPNEAEARQLSGGPAGGGLAAAAAAATVLRSRWQARAVVVTAGARGTVLDDGRTRCHLPATAVAVTDPCGAGDRFAATVAVRLLHGDVLTLAVGRAMAEAASFLADGGAGAIGRTEPEPVGLEPVGLELAGLEPAGPPVPVEPAGGQQIELDPAGSGAALTAAITRAEAVRSGGGTVVATGGCFDLLHTGHTRTLAAARQLGDHLIVCLNSDDSVARLKGPSRPINGQADRAELLRSLGFVDDVVIFSDDGPERVLERLRPDVWVKGGDYIADTLPEAALVRSWGGAVVVLPYQDGRSTTRLAHALNEVS